MSYLRKYVFSVILLLSFGHLEAACPANWLPIGSRCFRALTHEQADNWYNATDLCSAAAETAGGRLAYIDDCNLMKPISNYLSFLGYVGTKYWIGASDNAEEGNWIWTSGDSVTLGAPFWGSSEPGWIEEPNGGTDENCAVIDTEDQCYMHDEDCEAEYNILCEYVAVQETKNEKVAKNANKIDPQYTECPEGFELIATACFHFHYDPNDPTTLTTYSEAQDICTEEKSRLAILANCILYQQVVTYINDEESVQLPEKASYWIGATDSGREGTWNWDGVVLDLQTGCPFWGSRNGNPEPTANDENQNCGLLYSDNQYRFHDGECYKKAYPLCQLI